VVKELISETNKKMKKNEVIEEVRKKVEDKNDEELKVGMYLDEALC